MYTVKTLTEEWNATEILNYGLQTNQIIRQLKVPSKFIHFILSIQIIKCNRLQVAAGKAIYHHNRQRNNATIKLHSGMFDNNDNLFNDKLDTLFHEIAHHIAYFATNEHGHGFAWQYSLMQFGFEPKRCYNPRLTDYRGYKQRKEVREVSEVMNELGDLEL